MSSMSGFIALVLVLIAVFLALKLVELVIRGLLGLFEIRLGHGRLSTDSSEFDLSS